jgi:hypothetical protein
MGPLSFPRSFTTVVSCVFLLGIFAGVCREPQPPVEPNGPERSRLAQKYIYEKLPLWQRRLQLQDWNIAVFTVHPSNLRQHTLGNVHWDMEKKSAVIRVLDASDYQMPFHAALNDMEFTVVHELIHLELASLPRSEASRSDEEYAINRLADALLQFDRKDQPADVLTLRSPAVPITDKQADRSTP